MHDWIFNLAVSQSHFHSPLCCQSADGGSFSKMEMLYCENTLGGSWRWKLPTGVSAYKAAWTTDRQTCTQPCLGAAALVKRPIH